MKISRETLCKYNNNDFILLDEINKFVKKIGDSKGKNIILVGPRASGKTTIIVNYRYEHQLQGDVVILPNFNKLSNFLMTTRERMLEIELILCEELVKYISNDKMLEFYEVMIGNLKRDLQSKCMTRLYMPSDEFNIEVGIVLQNILRELKKEVNKKNIILIIDRFDWIKNSSKTFQDMLTFFFGFFYKTILITEDESILEESRLKRLNFNGYEVINVNYSKEVLTLKKLIVLRLKKYKCISMNVKKIMDDKNLENLIVLSNGNLDIIFNVLDEINTINYQLTDTELMEYINKTVYEKNKIYSLIPKKKLQI